MDSASLVCGVDEAGRGALAGPVVAAAVILDPSHPIEGLADSKTLSARQRERLAAEIRSRALAFGIGRSGVDEIDRLNVLQATMLAMRRAIDALALKPSLALIDGNICPELEISAKGIVRGDSLVASISAASILAKTSRDEEMRTLALCFPEYGFSRHMGYGTRSHLAAISQLGIMSEHRRSFRPVKILEHVRGLQC